MAAKAIYKSGQVSPTSFELPTFGPMSAIRKSLRGVSIQSTPTELHCSVARLTPRPSPPPYIPQSLNTPSPYIYYSTTPTHHPYPFLFPKSFQLINLSFPLYKSHPTPTLSQKAFHNHSTITPKLSYSFLKLPHSHPTQYKTQSVPHLQRYNLSPTSNKADHHKP